MIKIATAAPRIYCASDASDFSLGGVVFDDDGEVQKPTLTASICQSTHIFIKEVMAAHMTLDHILDTMFPQSATTTRAVIIICVDNTAALRALQRGYSTNAAANSWSYAYGRKQKLEV